MRQSKTSKSTQSMTIITSTLQYTLRQQQTISSTKTQGCRLMHSNLSENKLDFDLLCRDGIGFLQLPMSLNSDRMDNWMMDV